MVRGCPVTRLRSTSTAPAAGTVARFVSELNRFARAVDVATTPLVPQIAEGARAVARAIDGGGPSSGGLADLPGAFVDATRGLVNHPMATLRGAVAGAVEGAGQVASQLTSPLDAVLTATGLRSLRSAAPIVARGAQVAGNAAGTSQRHARVSCIAACGRRPDRTISRSPTHGGDVVAGAGRRSSDDHGDTWTLANFADDEHVLPCNAALQEQAAAKLDAVLVT
jgi:hypothetical protein